MISDPDSAPAVHDQVLVEARIDDAVVGFRAVVVNVQPSALWLGLSRPDPLLERLVADQPLQLTFRRDSAAVLADSSFRSHLGATRSRLFAVQRPSAMQLVQRRAHLRLDVERPVEITVATHGASGPAGRRGRGRTRNISAGGLQFATDMHLATGDEVELTIILEPGEAVPAEARVVRVDAPDDGAAADAAPRGQAACSWVAARFLSISDVAQDRIVRHIFSVQRQRRDEAAKKPA